MCWWKKTLKIIGGASLIVVLILVTFFIYINIPVRHENKQASLGVTFSYRYASDIGLDWKKAYLATLDDLKVRKIRIPIYWDLVEKKPGQYDFSAVDWQLAQAQARKAQIILVVGQKVPRWPECAIPQWANVDNNQRKTSLLNFIKVAVERYRNNHPEIKYWQVENEPFLHFGICPQPDAHLLDSEVAEVHRLDPQREVIVTDSGELGRWLPAAKRGDIFGTTMYRTVYKKGFGYYTYPLGPRFFRFKYGLIKWLVGQPRAIVAELQAEPWVSGYTTNVPLSQQFKSMNVKKLDENVKYARQVGFPDIYLWGVEWWYWLKVEKNHPELWQEAKKLFNSNITIKTDQKK